MEFKRIAIPMAFIVACQLVGLLGAMSGETGNSLWYQALDKPPFNPPSWAFAPAWITLYTLMGIAAFRIWRIGLDLGPVRGALGLFVIQLILNGAWTPVFFGAKQLLLALLVILALVAVLALTLRAFWRLDKIAGWLLAPYLAWVSFATLLNASIWWLNS